PYMFVFTGLPKLYVDLATLLFVHFYFGGKIRRCISSCKRIYKTNFKKLNMRTCFVPFCDVKNKDQPNRAMFSVPKDPSLYAQWAANLPNVKQLRRSDRVCYLHFKPGDINYTFGHIINGQMYQIQRDRPRLKPDAVPCLEMTSKEDLLSYRVRNREAKITKESNQLLKQQDYGEIIETQQTESEKEDNLNENIIKSNQSENLGFTIEGTDEIPDFIRTEVQTEASSEADNQIDLIIEECPEAYNDNNDMDLEESLTILNLFNLLYDNCYDILLPNSLWGIHRCPNRSALCFSFMDINQMKVTKIVTITMDGAIQLYANGFLISNLQLTQDIDDLDGLSILLNQVDLWRFCFGQSSNENCEIVVESNDENNCRNTIENEHIFFCRVCKQIS
ncbi:hypothetical protein DOY81_009897, partial [Sarcophaga bullata]